MDAIVSRADVKSADAAANAEHHAALAADLRARLAEARLGGGAKYQQYGAFCLESQKFPDAINKPGFPEAVLRPGEAYDTTTVFRFGTR